MDSQKKIIFIFCIPFQLVVGGVHKLSEINSLTHLASTHNIAQNEDIGDCPAPSRDSMVDTTCAISMHSQDRSLLTNIVKKKLF